MEAVSNSLLLWTWKEASWMCCWVCHPPHALPPALGLDKSPANTVLPSLWSCCPTSERLIAKWGDACPVLLGWEEQLVNATNPLSLLIWHVCHSKSYDKTSTVLSSLMCVQHPTEDPSVSHGSPQCSLNLKGLKGHKVFFLGLGSKADWTHWTLHWLDLFFVFNFTPGVKHPFLGNWCCATSAHKLPQEQGGVLSFPHNV